MRAFFFFFLLRELKLVKVIQSSAARYVRAGLFLRVEKTEREKKKKSVQMRVCLRMWSCFMCLHCKGRLEEKGEIKRKQGDWCSAPVKVSDSWLIVSYCE